MIRLSRSILKSFYYLFFAEKLETDGKLMYYLSYGTNGKANLEYIFRVVTEIINENLVL